ncbi:Sde2 N-terminal domain-containing protein [Phlyctochytrium arcticum]|nr:Sde2 N-terminal domain-containing protein [Phlyctochytrium arcticum]
MAAVQVLVNTFKGLQPLCLQFPPSPTEGELCNSIPTVADLKQRLTESHFPCLLPSDQLFTTLGGRLVPDSYPLYSPQNGSHPAEFNLLLRLPGGKGGFGSMLRAQGGKMASQKTTNFEACRDLQGRRLKTVNDAKR